MAAAVLRFYLDENMPVAIATQLVSRGIDVVTVRDLAALGESDARHLQRAAEMGRVLCTHDHDYIQLASTGINHSGIVFGQQDKHHIGTWVNALELMHAIYTADDLINTVEYL
ncbi:MAG: DUF5615 family PIN-like protein [Armatimonadetes bacterium]|nr:DUF5615 family PIN-like protein [Anaerolineae bacterium]